MRGKVTRSVVALALSGLVMTSLACTRVEADDTPITDFEGITYIEQETPRGKVPCLVFEGFKKGGLSCDWSAVGG